MSGTPSTPPQTKRSLVNPTSTPAVSKSTSQALYQYGTLEVARKTLMDSVPTKIPELPMSFFLERILPPIQSTLSVDDVISHLMADGTITNGRWSIYTVNPIASGVGENDTFSHLPKLIDNILPAVQQLKASLTWDSSIFLVKDGDVPRRGADKKPIHDITVYDQKNKRSLTYCTTRVLSDVAASDLHADRKLHAADPHRVKNGKSRLKDYLLTVLCHGDVEISPGVRDHTRKVMMRGEGFPEGYSYFDISISSERAPEYLSTPQKDGLRPSRSGKGVHRNLDHTHVNRPGIGKYPPKYHYRIVYSEVYDPLYRETSLDAALYACAMATYALQLLHELGWGTTYFMAIEVDTQEYLFLPSMSAKDENVNRTQLTAAAMAEKFERQMNVPPPQAVLSKPSPPDVPFRYLPLHDIESVWWIATYFVFNKAVVKIGDTPVVEGTTLGQQRFADGLFQKVNKRHATFLQTDPYGRAIKHLHAAIDATAKRLFEALERLVHLYETAEADPDNVITVIPDDTYIDIANYFFKGLLTGITLDPLRGYQEKTTGKRQHEEIASEANTNETTGQGAPTMAGDGPADGPSASKRIK
ncbi:hypothetical protein WOLCODRAFT_167882 [Wolfiporia cocos MD-104 SS10]|uniref:Fungal-type protein kinase domain-containing protein n=1 Tax=Wolfiporia cocos (strain MD-104) TaxID=742152 RepID=A0A2H3JBM1_WOLCO|nr:hypothetical protein WOLCODRAFT_167882 [Wolfiporia cocos MD-104 SS10]